MDKDNGAPEFLAQITAGMSTFQMVCLVLFAGTWIIGGNVLLYFHHRRMGRSGWAMLNPFQLPFRDFNRREWKILGLLALVSMSFGIIAIDW